MLNISSSGIRKSRLQWLLPHTCQVGIMKKTASEKCWQGCRQKETSMWCGCECTIVQPRWRQWGFLQKLKTGNNIRSDQSLRCVRLFAIPWTAAWQASLWPTPGAYSNSWPSCWWYHPTISPTCPLLLPPQSFLASGSFPMSQLPKVLEFQLQHLTFQWIFRTYFL